VGVEDNREAGEWQVGQLCRELSRPVEPEVMSGESVTAEWSRLTESLLDPTAQLSLKASLLPSALTDFLAAVPDDPRVYWQAHAGNGIVTVHWAIGELVEASRTLVDLRRRA